MTILDLVRLASRILNLALTGIHRLQIRLYTAYLIPRAVTLFPELKGKLHMGWGYEGDLTLYVQCPHQLFYDTYFHPLSELMWTMPDFISVSIGVSNDDPT